MSDGSHCELDSKAQLGSHCTLVRVELNTLQQAKEGCEKSITLAQPFLLAVV